MIYFSVMRKKLASVLKAIAQIITALLAAGFIIVGTILVYMYARGYRLDFDGKDIRETGVVNLESKPTRAEITINGEKNGKTPKTVASIDEGYAQVKLKKEKYYDWIKNVPVIREKSTPVTANMFLKEPATEVLVEIPKEYTFVKGQVSENRQHILYITKDKKNIYTIWRYDLNKSFWNLSNNPHIITTIEDPAVQNLTMIPSPGASNLLLHYSFTQSDITKTKVLLFNTEQVDTDGQLLNLEKFLGTYSITWAKSGSYIILESVNDVLSYNIESTAKSLLYKKAETENLVWTTDTSLNFYYLQKLSDNTGNYFTLEQLNLDGTNAKTLIPRIYYQTDKAYIENIRKTEFTFIPFSNTPQNTRFIGEISAISIDQTTKGIYISTEYAAYWYGTEEDKYIMINPYPSQLISISDNKRMALFKDLTNGYYGIFTFDKTQSDPVTLLGTKIVIKDEKEVTNVNWVNSANLSYQSEGSVYIMDKDGDNKVMMKTLTSPIYFSLSTSGKYIHTLESITNQTKVVKYTIQ
ncbi:MAG: Protein kinase [candidate division WS6 bacterium GW2011_GWF2_39_15]|uniref:Protein kinase n=1 Tax=candidate division WS6 bacterium GW2011_GWF2_39_15 TaxID=1619100 RepID=A0A0G0MTA8_9BACT|nr:MAG: Protein kinase [candidate division WS6 bacterium GW2011_GWF2_39_15]